VSYGSDTWCGDRLVTGRQARSAVCVALALYRRLITPRGTLRGGDEEDAYGIDLAAYVGAVGYATAIGAIPGIVRAEMLKDDRVTDVSVEIASAHNTDGSIYIVLDCVVTLADEDEEFSLSVGVSETSVTLIGLPEV
jgi:hypothetical protein